MFLKCNEKKIEYMKRTFIEVCQNIYLKESSSDSTALSIICKKKAIRSISTLARWLSKEDYKTSIDYTRPHFSVNQLYLKKAETSGKHFIDSLKINPSTETDSLMKYIRVKTHKKARLSFRECFV